MPEITVQAMKNMFLQRFFDGGQAPPIQPISYEGDYHRGAMTQYNVKKGLKVFGKRY
jgi:hypothetical protein